jgi:MFS family permease
MGVVVLKTDEINVQKETKLTKYQRKVLWATSSGIALENMDIMFLAFSLSSIINTFTISSAAAGLISTITNLGMLVGGIFFGILADKYGRVKIFSYTVITFSLASALMFFASNIYLVYLFRFLAGIGAGGEYGACMSLVSESFEKKNLGKMTSIVAIGAQVGAILAAVLASLIIPLLGWKMLYVIGALPIFLIIYIRKGLHESTTFVETVSNDKKQTSIWSLFKDRATAWQTIGLCLMVTIQIAGYFGLMNWLPSIMQAQLGLSVSGSSLWMISTIFGMSLGMMTFGIVMDKIGARKAYTIFLVLSALSVFLIVLSKDKWTLLIFTMIVGYFINGMYGGYGAIISNLYPTEIRATANNVIMNVGRAIGGFSSILIGFLMDRYNLFTVVGFLAIIYIISLCIMLSIPSLKKGGAVL